MSFACSFSLWIYNWRNCLPTMGPKLQIVVFLSSPGGRAYLGLVTSCNFDVGNLPNASLAILCNDGYNRRSFEIDFYCNQEAGVHNFKEITYVEWNPYLLK